MESLLDMSGMKDRFTTSKAFAAASALAALAPSAALAATNGQPQPGQLGLAAPATSKMADIVWFHNSLLLPIITVITLFVLALLIYVCWRFSEGRNPTPTRTTHHAGLEVAWTLIPCLILVVIAIPSFRILKDQLTMPAQADVTLKVTGKQWLWEWEYAKDSGGFTFTQLMLDDQQLNEAVSAGRLRPDEAPRLLAVDNEAVVPVGKVVRLQVTAGDVIHKFALPAFGLKLDAIPGRLNETWFKAEQEGIFYGQCSHVCGERHAFMPIAIRVVSQERYAQWLEEAKRLYARSDAAPSRIAAAAP